VCFKIAYRIFHFIQIPQLSTFFPYKLEGIEYEQLSSCYCCSCVLSLLLNSQSVPAPFPLLPAVGSSRVLPYQLRPSIEFTCFCTFVTLHVMQCVRVWRLSFRCAGSSKGGIKYGMGLHPVT